MTQNQLDYMPISFGLTMSAYLLQQLSDIFWVDSVSMSTRLARLASIRHYRAAEAISEEAFKFCDVTVPILKINENKENTIKNFCEIDRIVENALFDLRDQEGTQEVSAEKESQMGDSPKETEKSKIINSYLKMLEYTQYIAGDQTETEYLSSSSCDYLNAYICLQCGEVYESIEDVKTCEYCGAGINQLERIKDLV